MKDYFGKNANNLQNAHEKRYSLLCNQPDWVCPVVFGAITDCGSMCVGIEYATGKKPIFIGKPEPTMIFELMKKFGYEKKDVVVIGDRLYTDIASEVNAGVDTICMLTGEATLDNIAKATPSDTPVRI